MLKRLSAPLVALAAVFAGSALPAEAIQFSQSSTTGKGGTILPLRFETPRIGPVGAELGVKVIPGLSSFLGPAGLNAGYNELSSMGVDSELNLAYHWQLADVNFLGRFNPTLAPYVGYRYLGAFTSEGVANLSAQGIANSYSQYGGFNYGLRAYTELPLGFAAHAKAGLTTLTTGGWDTRQNGLAVTGAGKTNVGGTTLPVFGVGASWNLLNALEIYVGYDMMTLPTGMRTQAASLPGAQSTINSLNVGLRFLFFSI